MRVVILAAGTGSRLKPFTANTPKCLFRLGKDDTILSRAVSIVRESGVDDICVVTGFQHALIERSVAGVSFVQNPFYRVTNSIASLWFAREYLDDEVVLINSDVVFQHSLFKSILEFDRSPFVVMDSSRTLNADYKVAVLNRKVVMMGKDLTNSSGEYAGITRLSKDAASRLREKIESMVSDDQIDEWYETALVSMILEDSFSLYYMDIPEYAWTEVDSPNDLLEAKRIHEMGKQQT